MMIVATMDLQARAYVLQMTQHNGEYGCLFCLEADEVVKSGKANCRSYPYREVKPEPITIINIQADEGSMELIPCQFCHAFHTLT